MGRAPEIPPAAVLGLQPGYHTEAPVPCHVILPGTAVPMPSASQHRPGKQPGVEKKKIKKQELFVGQEENGKKKKKNNYEKKNNKTQQNTF